MPNAKCPMPNKSQRTAPVLPFCHWNLAIVNRQLALPMVQYGVWNLARTGLCGSWCYSICRLTRRRRGTLIPNSADHCSRTDSPCCNIRCMPGTAAAKKTPWFISTGCKAGCRTMGKSASSRLRTNSLSGCGFSGEKRGKSPSISRNSSLFFSPNALNSRLGSGLQAG